MWHMTQETDSVSSLPNKGFSWIGALMAAHLLDLNHSSVSLRTFIFSSSVCVQVPISRDILMLV